MIFAMMIPSRQAPDPIAGAWDLLVASAPCSENWCGTTSPRSDPAGRPWREEGLRQLIGLQARAPDPKIRIGVVQQQATNPFATERAPN
jgi:hypothetical protein